MPHEGSGWFINDVELPDAPETDQRLITRSFQAETLFNFFPQITKSSARAFDYTISGVVYPESIAFALDQIAKSADTNTVILTIPESQRIFLATKYAVKSLRFARKGPLFIFHIDKVVQAIPFSLTFTELPDEGEFQDGLDGFTDADEGALGLQQLNELNEIIGNLLDSDLIGPREAFEINTTEELVI